jgi:hypothetical protein
MRSFKDAAVVLGIALPDGAPFLPGDDLQGWHLSGNDGSRTHDSPFSDHRSGHNRNPDAQPHIVADHYRLRDTLLPERQGTAMDVVVDSPDNHTRSKNHIVPDGKSAPTVHNRATVDETIFANGDVVCSQPFEARTNLESLPDGEKAGFQSSDFRLVKEVLQTPMESQHQSFKAHSTSTS